jgi:hypothetical protein
MAARKWDVWSIDRENLRGLVVHEGISEKEATAAAGKRNATALRLKMSGTAFVALPQGQQPAESDLPPRPAVTAAELAAQARNKNPLHSHDDGPWTADTRAAHLVSMHGVDGAREDQGLEFLTEVHDLLGHGEPAKGELRADWAHAPADSGYLGILTRQPHSDRFTRGAGQKFTWSCRHVHLRQREAVTCAEQELRRRAALRAEAELRRRSPEEPEPGRRYSRICWGPLRTSDNPADADLYLESPNGTSIVCFSPGDMPGLRAAVLPETEGLKALQDIWSANLGPGGRRAVEAGHAAGYKLGVEDRENTPAYRTAPADADAVISFLTGLAGTPAAIQGGKLDALGTVVEFLEQLKAGSGDEADRG